jgi:hypothetical protein
VLVGANPFDTGPYGSTGDFFCDVRNIRNSDFDREIVIQDACSSALHADDPRCASY